MKIRFYLDEKLYEGTAQALQKPDEVDFRVDLEGLPIFTIRPCKMDGWETKAAVSQDIARSAGLEIERTENAGFLNIEPGKYYSFGITGGAEPEIHNGEIINELEDVEDQSNEEILVSNILSLEKRN